MTVGIAERLGQQDELLRAVMDRVKESIWCAMPGIIDSFDATTQTATVRLALREKAKVTGQFPLEDVELRPLVDVPVGLPRAGGYLLTLPVTAGDECLVVFGDMCIDAWVQSGGVQSQLLKRRHALSDAFALPLIWSQPRKVSNYSTDSAQLRNEDGTAYVDLSATALTLQFGTSSIVLNAAGVEVNP